MRSAFIKIVCICCCTIGLAQNDSAYFYFDNTTPIALLESKFKNSKKSTDAKFYKLIYHSRLRDSDSMSFYINQLEQDKNLTKFQQCRVLYFEGFYNKITSNDSLFFKKSYQTLQLAKKAQDTLTTLSSLAALSQTYDYNNDNYYNLEYLNILEQKAKEYNHVTYKIIHRFLLATYYYYRDENNEALRNYKMLLGYNYKKRDSAYLLYTYNNLGALFEDNLLQSDSAIYYFNKKLDFFKKSPSHTSKESYFNTYFNIGVSYERLNKLDEAEKFYLKADSVSTRENILKNSKKINENLSDLFAKQKNYHSAYNSLKLSLELSDSLNTKEHHEAIANIKEQYDNQKLRADNLESEVKRKQNQNLLIVSLFLLVFGGFSAFLIQKNTKRKQLLAEQEQEIQTQKLATVLKEQELTSIDAMIEGQEKERQRIANDLHDDLGGLMATVKLHFNVLKENKSEDLFEKTNTLLDEAYQKIRSIAHAKNSGVIAKQGLLKAVNEMANKISALNKTQIDVVDHGLENRLENSLELTIFRIIQELTTNIIKHAQATQATISLTNHEDSLNIMIEDNGVGFDTKTISKKGMGIHSIDKRVEHLEGSMTIESEIHQGTTIIIDLPI